MVLGDALAMCLMELKEFKPKDFAQIHPSGTLGKKLQLKICHLINKSKKPSVSPKDSMRDVIFEISEKRLGATIVEHNDRILGLITDGDIRRVLEHNSSISGITAQHMMTKNPVQINENFLAFEALKMMKSRKINHLVVTGTGNKYLGIVHILDLIKEGLDG
jgi:arabinose-5-phosphate isomerase